MPRRSWAATLRDMNHVQERRQGRTDRRDASRPAVPPGPERRASGGCRRRLPEPRWRRWPSIGAAALLGVAAAFALQAVQGSPVAAAPGVAEPRATPEVVDRLPVPRITLPEAQALRDEAGALTRAQVMLDEQAHATWLPRLGPITAAAADPRVAELIREELREALAALERVGIAAGRRGPGDPG